MYHVFRTPAFVEQYDVFDEYHQERIRGFIHQLSWKGPLVGKPLGSIFLREKKFNGNRMYFLVYDEWRAVLLVMFSDKKKQSATIALIKEELSFYREFVYQQLKEQGLI